MILDKDTFEQLYYQYGPRLSAYAYRFLTDKNAVDDLVQDVFVRFWERYHGRESATWVPVIFTMVRNRCLDHIKHATLHRHLFIPNTKMTKEEEHLFLEDLGGPAAADEELLMHELNNQIALLMDGLTPKCREVFRLSRVECLKNSEIAERLGISEKAVEKHITAALKHFRKNI